MEACQNPDVLRTIMFVSEVLKIIFIVVPIILIVILGVDILKTVVATNDKDMKRNISMAVKRMIACVCVFFVPLLVSLFNSLLANSDVEIGYGECLVNANNDYIEMRIVEIAEEYLEVAKENKDGASINEAKQAIDKITDETEKQIMLDEIEKIEEQLIKDADKYLAIAKEKKTMPAVIEAEKYIRKIIDKDERKKRMDELNKIREEITSTEYDLSYYHKFYNALSILHSGQPPLKDNTIALYESAGQAKFYGAECDLRMNGSTLYCAHDVGPGSATKFVDYLNICKKYKMKAILDIKYASSGWSYNYSSMLNTLGDYISNNNLKDIVIVQTSDIGTMNQINRRASGVKYWYLITNSSGYSKFVSNMSSFKSAGVVSVNMILTVSSSSTVKNIKNNGFKVCVYSLDSDGLRKQHAGYGADYIMTNRTDN